MGAKKAHIIKALDSPERWENCTPERQVRVLDIMKQIANGKTRESIERELVTVKGYCVSQAACDIALAMERLACNDTYREEIISVNIKRIETMLEEAMAKSDLKSKYLALNLIKELNSMCGLRDKTTQVAIRDEEAKKDYFIAFDA